MQESNYNIRNKFKIQNQEQKRMWNKYIDRMEETSKKARNDSLKNKEQVEDHKQDGQLI